MTGHHAAVAGNLHGIFSRKCPWRTHHSKQHFIHRTVVLINNVPVVDGVRSGFGGFSGVHSSGPKTPVGHHHSVIARKADDRQRALAQWRGNGGNGVVDHGGLMRAGALLWILPLQKQPGFLVTFLVHVMQQIRRGAARQLGGQIVEPPKQPYQIRLGLSVHLRHGVLQFQQGIEDGLFGLGHGVEITCKHSKIQA